VVAGLSRALTYPYLSMALWVSLTMLALNMSWAFLISLDSYLCTLVLLAVWRLLIELAIGSLSLKDIPPVFPISYLYVYGLIACWNSEMLYEEPRACCSYSGIFIFLCVYAAFIDCLLTLYLEPPSLFALDF
jgi:hypothetical protein